MSVPTGAGNYPAGVKDSDFDMPSVEDEDDEGGSAIPCSLCGKPTTFDPTYGDLCYRCCRAENE